VCLKCYDWLASQVGCLGIVTCSVNKSPLKIFVLFALVKCNAAHLFETAPSHSCRSHSLIPLTPTLHSFSFWAQCKILDISTPQFIKFELQFQILIVFESRVAHLCFLQWISEWVPVFKDSKFGKFSFLDNSCIMQF
jgi:hypothetical protein